MKAILVNYCWDPKDWWLKYGLEAVIYDRSDDGIARKFTAETYKTLNMGDVDYDKLSYLVTNYDNLPDVFVWGKTNLFKYVDEEYFAEALKKREFTPLLKFDHVVYQDQFGVVCRYKGNMYEERADSWFFNNPQLAANNFSNWKDWCDHFGLPKANFIPFAPGGNYILTRERVHYYSRDYYDKMRSKLLYATHPAEAHAAERSYFLLWK